MSRIRKYKATLLLLMFVMGSVVAPFSHYMFMLVSDAYAVGGHHGHEHHELAHHSEHHTTDQHASEQGIALKSESSQHISCDYWGLFATFTATAPPAAQVGFPAKLITLLAQEVEETHAAVTILTYRLRGPPQLLS